MGVVSPLFEIYSGACSCPETPAHFPLELDTFLVLEITLYYYFFNVVGFFGGVSYLFQFNWNKVFKGDYVDVLIYAQHKQLECIATANF